MDLLPNRGAVALSLGEQDVIDTFEVMANLEAQSGGWPPRASPTTNSQRSAPCTSRCWPPTRRDLPRYYALNAQIHACINAAAKNRC